MNITTLKALAKEHGYKITGWEKLAKPKAKTTKVTKKKTTTKRTARK